MLYDDLIIENVSKHFASFVALQSIHLRIEHGQFVLLAGANGAGKSTLLRLIAGITRPSSGRVLIGGRDTQRDAAARSAIGFLSHHTLLYDDLSAEENLGFFARIHAIADPQQRIEEALEQVGLVAHRHRRLRAFSRGMRQRLALARATLHGPVLLLLDEPFTGLDQPARAALSKRLCDLRKAGHTCIMVTHNPEEGASLANRLVILRKGRLCYDQAWEGSAIDLAATCAPFWDGLR